jgi:hypothetical protein
LDLAAQGQGAQVFIKVRWKLFAFEVTAEKLKLSSSHQTTDCQRNWLKAFCVIDRYPLFYKNLFEGLQQIEK